MTQDFAPNLPVTPMQQALLVPTLATPQAGVNLEQLVGTLREDIDPAAFQNAWQWLVERHAILRTSFSWEGAPLQRVHAAVTLPFAVEDWREFSAEEQARRGAEWLRADRTRGFDPAVAPLLRVTLFQLGAAHWQFVWTFHHALLDGRSFPLLLREVFARLEGNSADQPPRPFREYVDWLDRQDCSASRKFWQQLLDGYDAPSAKAFDPTAMETCEIRVALVDQLNAFAAQLGVTLNTVLQGAWALLLARTRGVEDVCFGTIRAGRKGTVPEAENMAGLFINTVPVRVRVPGEAMLRAWLRELRGQHVAQRSHERTSLAEIQRWSGLPGDAALFDTLFAFENHELNERLREGGERWNAREFELFENTGLPLTLNVTAGRQLAVRASFSPSRFSAEEVAGLLARLEILLRAFLTNANTPLAKIPMFAEGERHRLLHEWNQATRTFPDGPFVHERFAAHAARTPNAVAISFGTARLTYGELNAQANQLAHHLRALGAGPETPIALQLERGLEMVVAILAVLKAGAAYVPCEPDLPAERFAFILADTAAPIVLTHEMLSRDQELIAQQPTTDPVTGVGPRNLAYIIYTSGSTGAPKGVCVTHRNVAGLFDATEDWFHFGAGDVWTLFHSYAFDFSVWEIWGALCHGGRLVVVPKEVTRAPDAFLALLAEEKITVLNQTPSAFRQLIGAENYATQISALRLVIFGGEALDLSALRPWFDRHGDSQPQLVNMYGITETTVHVTYRPLTAADAASSASVIGRAIPDLDLYILDPSLEPCPIGIPGELHVGGAGLARGYLHRDELTAERFIPNPHQPDKLLYKTGDRARYLPNGDIEYLGRLDQQIKVRGHRVELGEIESAIRAFAGVRDAVVLLREDAPGDQRLAGYVVASTLDATALRDFLRERLPAYMIPAGFVFLEQLPLTANGKLDRRALPPPRQSKAASAPAGNALEQTIAAVWREVLHIEQPGLDQSFFDLGGHSLLMVRVHGRLRAILGTDLAITKLFQFPTIRALARHLAPDETQTAPAITAQDRATRQRAAFARRREISRSDRA